MDTRMRLTRLRHSLLPGRGSPARPSDRLQARLLGLVILLSLVAAAGAVLLGIGVYAVEAAKSREQTATRYTVAATLLTDGPLPAAAGRGGTPFDSGPARATWWTRDGQQRVGDVDAPAGAAAGRRIDIWLDRTGTPSERPLTAAAAVVGGPLAALTFWAAVTSVLVGGYRVVVFVLDRHRFAQWQREWTALQTGRPRRDDQSPAGS
ncbi:Rv1733c family protein [Amycolatopsis sp. NPDC003865]